MLLLNILRFSLNETRILCRPNPVNILTSLAWQYTVVLLLFSSNITVYCGDLTVSTFVASHCTVRYLHQLGFFHQLVPLKISASLIYLLDWEADAETKFIEMEDASCPPIFKRTLIHQKKQMTNFLVDLPGKVLSSYLINNWVDNNFLTSKSSVNIANPI